MKGVRTINLWCGAPCAPALNTPMSGWLFGLVLICLLHTILQNASLIKLLSYIQMYIYILGSSVDMRLQKIRRKKKRKKTCNSFPSKKICESRKKFGWYFFNLHTKVPSRIKGISEDDKQKRYSNAQAIVILIHIYI